MYDNNSVHFLTANAALIIPGLLTASEFNSIRGELFTVYSVSQVVMLLMMLL